MRAITLTSTHMDNNMKVTGKIIRIRSSKRESYNKNGITLVFETELGLLVRTFSISPHLCQRNLLFNTLKTFPAKIPFTLLDKPVLFCLAAEKLLKDIEFNLVIAPSASEKYPYNILEMHPILTVNNKYSTANNQETISTKVLL